MCPSIVSTKIHSGMLLGNHIESTCKVDITTKLKHGKSPVATHYEIVWIPSMLPDGEYMLTVNGAVVRVRRSGGGWHVFPQIVS